MTTHGGRVAVAALVAALVATALVSVLVPDPVEAQSRPVIYLTYDDGPDSRGRTTGVLDALRRHGAQATFFVLGAAVIEDPATTQRMLAEGHALGNHTVTHPRLTDLGPAEVAAQLSGAQGIIASRTGVTPTCFRPPFGATNSMVAQSAASLGMTQVLWDRAGWDWELTNPDDVLTSIGPLWDGAVVLLHDTAPTVVTVTERLLQQYGATHDFRTLPACASGATPPVVTTTSTTSPSTTTTTVPPTTTTTAPPTTPTSIPEETTDLDAPDDDAAVFEPASIDEDDAASPDDVVEDVTDAPVVERDDHLRDELRRAYLLVLERAPDPDGLEHWAHKRAVGWTIDEVAAALASSEEHDMWERPTLSERWTLLTGVEAPDTADLAELINDPRLVEATETAAPGDVDAATLRIWRALTDTDGPAPDDNEADADPDPMAAIAMAIQDGPLDDTEMSDDAFVRSAYELVLDRRAGDDEVAAWLELFDLGLTRIDVVAAIVHSPESILMTGTMPPR